MEGIASMHSWIKAQTMIRPTKLGKGGFGGEGFDDDMEVFNSLENYVLIDVIIRMMSL